MEKIYVKVTTRKLLGCFSCALCHKLLDHATTITECLHTFCRTCIHDKLTKENLKACPVCNVHLGVAPLDKLRTDNTWGGLRQRVFKPQPMQESVKTATEATVPALQLKYSRKKEKPLSVLMASSSTGLSSPESNPGEKVEVAPKISRSSGPTQKAGEGTSKGCIQKDNNSGIDSKKLQTLSDVCMSLSTTDKEVAPGVLVEATITLNRKSAQKDHILISSDEDTQEDCGEKGKGKGKEKCYSPPVLRPRVERRNNSAGTSQKAIYKAAEIIAEGSNKEAEVDKPVWFSLVASPNQVTTRPLPQIEKTYIKVKNGNCNVSHVKKYIVRRLNLESEDEVEIWLRHGPVSSTMVLHSLLDWWLQTIPASERRIPMPGSSAPELVMVLHYGRRETFL